MGHDPKWALPNGKGWVHPRQFASLSQGNTETNIYTHSQLIDNLESPIILWDMFQDCERKLEHLEKICACMGTPYRKDPAWTTNQRAAPWSMSNLLFYTHSCSRLAKKIVHCLFFPNSVLNLELHLFSMGKLVSYLGFLLIKIFKLCYIKETS